MDLLIFIFWLAIAYSRGSFAVVGPDLQIRGGRGGGWSPRLCDIDKRGRGGGGLKKFFFGPSGLILFQK